MAKHLYYTLRDGRDVVIAMGRDHQLAEYYLQISYVEATMTPLYTSASVRGDREVRPLDHFRSVMRKIGLQVPRHMWQAVQQDSNADGRRLIEHFDDGSWREVELE